MVVLQVKRVDDTLFLYECKVNDVAETVIREITAIYNGRLKIYRICMEIEELIEHGIQLPHEMQGLTDEQIDELKLKDIYAEKCIPSGGSEFNRDQMGRRNGQRPKEHMRNVLKKAMDDAKTMIDKKLANSKRCLTLKIIDEALSILRGAVTIVYPMQLPPYDNIRLEFSNTEDLSGTQASLEVIEPSKAQLWFAGRQILPDKKLSEYFGTNDKTKLIVKLNRHGEGPPAREAVITEDVRKRMMAEQYRRQEELKKLDLDDDDSYMNSEWADGGNLKRKVHGLDNVRFRF